MTRTAGLRSSNPQELAFDATDWRAHACKAVGPYAVDPYAVDPLHCRPPYAVDPYAVDVAMWMGALEFDLLLGDVHSLKQKRSVVRPLIAELRKRFELSVAEVDHLELHRRAAIGVAAVSSDRAHLVEVLDAVEQLVAYRPEIELLSVRRMLRSADD
jgi:uncharacterized protein YlxP (DUF503 family)